MDDTGDQKEDGESNRSTLVWQVAPVGAFDWRRKSRLSLEILADQSRVVCKKVGRTAAHSIVIKQNRHPQNVLVAVIGDRGCRVDDLRLETVIKREAKGVFCTGGLARRAVLN